MLSWVRVDEQLCQVGDSLLQELDLVHVLVAQAAQPVGGGEDAGMLSAVRVRAVLAPSSTCQGGNRPDIARLDRVPGWLVSQNLNILVAGGAEVPRAGPWGRWSSVQTHTQGMVGLE